MEEENIGPFRRTSARTKKMAGKMVAALASTDNRTQLADLLNKTYKCSFSVSYQQTKLPMFHHREFERAALARLEALENDNAGAEVVDLNDDGDASLDDDDQVYTKRQLKNTRRKTRHAKALENSKKAPRTFLEVLQDQANLESLPPHVPTYLRAAVGPPSAHSRRHFCTVCGVTANYTCVKCGMRFCSCRCKVIHDDTRCLKFVA